MDTNKNSYTIIYATVLVILVAAVLAFVSQALKERQQKNIDVEKKMIILESVGLAKESNTAPNKLSYIEQEYDKYITKSFVVNAKGEQIEGDAFRVDLKEQFDITKQIANASSEQQDVLKAKLKLPVFVCTFDDDSEVYIFSCYGAGLWGPIWGYISLNANLNTIYGAVFDHKSETPGLGAEISTPTFSKQFNGKDIFQNGNLSSIIIMKGGAPAGSKNEIDAISGGTITSKALEATISNWLNYYQPYLVKEQQAKEQAKIMEQASAAQGSDSLSVADSLNIANNVNVGNNTK